MVSVAEFENKFFYLRKTNLKTIINKKQQLHQTAVISIPRIMDLNVKLSELLEKGKANRKVFSHLKNAAVHAQSYELAAFVKQVEKEAFPDTQEESEIREKVKEIKLLFEMVGLNVNDKACYLIYESNKLFNKKKGKFDLKDAVKIVADSNRIFYDE